MPFGAYDRNDFKIAQSEQLDAFGRLRVSQPTVAFCTKFDIADKAFLFSDSTATGGTVTRNATTSSIDLAATTSSGSSAIRQSKEYVHYTPGQSLQIYLTGKFGTAKANCRQRLGHFDASNGVFFELNGTTLNVVQRSSATGSTVDTAVAQSSWNIDPLTGAGESGITLDLTKQQIFFIDYQWLGSGRVRFGVVINGRGHICHEIYNANVLDVPWSQTATLPIRFEIVNTGATSGATTLRFTCASVLNEGINDYSVCFGSARRGTDLTVTTSTFVPVLSVRLKSTHARATLIPAYVSPFTTSLDLTEWVVVMNPTLTGASFASSGTNSSFEQDTTASALSGGDYLHAFFSSDNAFESLYLDKTLHRLGADISGTRDIITLAARTLSGSSSVNASMTFREIY